MKSMNIENIGMKKMCEFLLVGFAAVQFIIYLILIVLEHQTSKIMIMGSINILTSFFGLLFVIFTLLKDLKKLHRKSYMGLGVLAFVFRGICLFKISYYYKSPREDFFVTNQTDNALLYSNFIWMGCYIALFYVRPKHQQGSMPGQGRMISDFS